MAFIHHLHVLLAHLTVLGFVLRAVWSFSGSSMLQKKPVRVLPHIVDTLLLICGLTLAFNIGYPLTSGWLAAKLLALLAYIGFGVVTLRAGSVLWRLVGFGGAIASVGYIFMVAYSRNPIPF